MFHIVTLLLFSSIMFAAVYQFSFNKNDIMMMMIYQYRWKSSDTSEPHQRLGSTRWPMEVTYCWLFVTFY